MRLTLADEEYDLGPGDAVTVPELSPHRWENASAEPVEILMVSSRKKG